MTPDGEAPARRPVPAGVIGMVHLLPLPGAPGWEGDMAAVRERARADARALAAGRVNAILVENFGDAPFFRDAVPATTVAAMTAAVLAVMEEAAVPVGVNVLRNDAMAAIAVAAATGAAFVRVNIHTGGMFTDQGWIEGRAAETVRARERLAPHVSILADILVKHAVPPSGTDLAEAAREAWERGRADGLIVSGSATGRATDLADVDRVIAAVPGAPILVGSGVTRETVAAALRSAHAVIVGTALEREARPGSPVEAERVRDLVEAARGS